MTAVAPPPRQLREEVLLVFGVSLGADALTAAITFVGSLTRGPLNRQVAVIDASRAPGRPTLDLIFQLAAIAIALVPVFLAAHLLRRSNDPLASIGADASQPGVDLRRGAALAATVGGAGLLLYVVSHLAGVNLTVVPEQLPAVWWRIPVLLLSAAQNGVLEEVLVVGYLLRRLDQLGWSHRRSAGASAVLRGSYHLYQGLGGFAGNLAMGLIFVWLYRRWGRVAPLVVAHTLIDVAAFVGYALLAGHVSWLPVPPAR